MKSFRLAAALCLSSLAIATLAPKAISPAMAADPSGTWLVQDKDGQIKMVNCGGAICGTLAWIKDPNDQATGQPKTDKNNPDPAKKSRPLLGVPIVLKMKPSGQNVWSGDVYNTEDGKTYSGSFTLSGPDTADLKGCVLSVLCKSQTWTRVH